METNWNIKCPHCNHQKEYVGDNWLDELIDTMEDTEITCSRCDKVFYVLTEAEYKFSASTESDY